MSWKSTPRKYGSVVIAIHWLSAAAILALFALGIAAANAPDSATAAGLLRFHVPLGLLALALTLLRIVWWIVFDRRPAPPVGTPPWQWSVERVVRVLLYVLILVMGASGIATVALSGAARVLFFGAPGPLPDFWRFPPMNAHFIGAIALIALAGLHIVAALYHHFWRRDRLLGRMGIGALPN